MSSKHSPKNGRSGDFPGLPYEDTIPTGTTQLGTLQQSSAADGTIAPGGTESFQITPGASACDKPAESVPYRADVRVQVTAPGAQLVTLDLSAYVINPA